MDQDKDAFLVFGMIELYVAARIADYINGFRGQAMPESEPIYKELVKAVTHLATRANAVEPTAVVES